MRKWLLSAALLLAACEQEERAPAPTADEAEQLNNAEAMLNEVGSDPD